MSRDMVLVPMSRETAEAWARPDLSADGLDAVALAGLDRASGQIHDAVIAALDTDRRHLVCLLAAMVFEFATGREWPDASDSEIRECDEFAGRVLALLENGGQEA